MKYIFLILSYSFIINFQAKAQYFDFNNDNIIVSLGYAPSKTVVDAGFGNHYYHGTDIKLFYQVNKSMLRYGIGLQYLLRGSRYSYQQYIYGNETYKLVAYQMHSISLPLYAKKALFKSFFVKVTLAPTYVFKATGTGFNDFEETQDEFIVRSKNLLKTEEDHFGSTDPINQFNVYGSFTLSKEINIKNRTFEVGLEYARDLFDTINLDRDYKLPVEKLHWLSLNVAIIID
jgi:hypothetical protein